MSWISLADVTLHSGRRSSFKIECDDLTDDEIAAGCALLAKVLPPFRGVSGVPRGGLRLAAAMNRHATVNSVGWNTLPWLIIDDVWTTGESMQAFRRTFPDEEKFRFAAFFARGPVPPDVAALFTIHPNLYAS